MIFVDAIIAGVVRQFPGFKKVLLTLIHTKWVTHRIADQTSLAKRVTHRIADRTSLKTSILHLLILLYIQIIAPTKKRPLSIRMFTHWRFAFDALPCCLLQWNYLRATFNILYETFFLLFVCLFVCF